MIDKLKLLVESYKVRPPHSNVLVSEIITLFEQFANETTPQKLVNVDQRVSPKTADEDKQNLIELFWVYLRNIESRTKPSEDILDKIAVEDGYKIWNKIHNSKLKARWER